MSRILKYDFVAWINSQKARWILHVLFWLAVLAFYTFFFGHKNVNYKITFSFVMILLPVTIATTYFLNYILIPNYLFKKRYAKFLLYFIYSLVISFYISIGTVVLIFIVVAEFNMEELHPANANAILLIAGMYAVVFLGVALKLFSHYNSNQLEIQKLKGEKIEAELKFLKAQLHPHFLFNTLNNLYALTLEKSDKASDVVLKLSELLDYILYDCKAEFVLLKKEIKQIENYIELEQLRFGDRLNVDFKFENIPATVAIPPMLLMTLVENSFKHGVSKTADSSWIKIHMYTEDDQLIFNIKNPVTSSKKMNKEISGGIGLQNLMNRLQLIYKDNYTLQIEEKDGFFEVHLVIQTFSKL